MWRASCRDEVQQVLKIAVGAERHVFRQNSVQLAARVGAFRLQKHRSASTVIVSETSPG